MPKMPDAFIDTVSKRYIKAYEMITGKKFKKSKSPIKKRIKNNLDKYLKQKV